MVADGMKIGARLGEARIRALREQFDHPGLMRLLGVRIADLRLGLAELHLPFRADLAQHHGFFHAGASSSIADQAGGIAGFTMFPEGSSVLTVEFKLNLINPAKGDLLQAVGRVIKPGRTLTICQLDVWSVSGDTRQHVATGLQTLIRIPTPDPN